MGNTQNTQNSIGSTEIISVVKPFKRTRSKPTTAITTARAVVVPPTTDISPNIITARAVVVFSANKLYMDHIKKLLFRI